MFNRVQAFFVAMTRRLYCTEGGYASLVITFLSLNLLIQIKPLIRNRLIDNEQTNYVQAKNHSFYQLSEREREKPIHELFSIIEIILQTTVVKKRVCTKNQTKREAKKNQLTFNICRMLCLSLGYIDTQIRSGAKTNVPST